MNQNLWGVSPLIKHIISVYIINIIPIPDGLFISENINLDIIFVDIKMFMIEDTGFV